MEQDLGDIEEYLARKGFILTTLDANGAVRIHGTPEFDHSGRLWMWYSHLAASGLEIGVLDIPDHEILLKVKERSTSRAHAREFRINEFSGLASMLSSILELTA